ncbi:YXWGXW repeat-containing protein [soil metagenome]
MLFVGLPLASSSAYIGISVGIAPPPLPVYAQPACSVAGYAWTPGYWGYGGVGYYWVPGVWVPPPRIGFYWTPGYWGYNSGSYIYNSGYWGPRVGFYGGINYGYGYSGSGYHGGQWAGNVFRYNTAVSRVNTTVIRNVYVNKTVINNYGNARPRGASFNGPGGARAKASAQEQEVAPAERIEATPEQKKVREAAVKNPDFHASRNKGKPKLAAVKTADELPAAGSGAGDGDRKGRKGAKAGMAGDDFAEAEMADAGINGEAGRKRARAQNAGDDAEQDGANADAGNADTQDRRGKKAARDAGDGRQADNAGDSAGRNADDETDAPAAESGRENGKRATAMPSQANEPNLPPTARDNGRAEEAIANRGPQNRRQPVTQRPSRGNTPSARRMTQRPSRTTAPSTQRAPQQEQSEDAKKRKAKKKRPEGEF